MKIKIARNVQKWDDRLGDFEKSIKAVKDLFDAAKKIDESLK